MISQLGFIFDMDSSHLVGALVCNSMEAFPIVCYCILLVKKVFLLSNFDIIKKTTTNELSFSSQNRTKQKCVSKSLFNGEKTVPKSFPKPKWTVPQSFPRRKEAISCCKKHPCSMSVLSQGGLCLSQFWGGMAGISPSLGVLLSQQLFGDATPMKLHYIIPLSINLSALHCPQPSLI